MDKAKAAANKALELDPTLGDAHKALAFVQFLLEWKWREAEQSFRRAIELDPSRAETHSMYALLLVTLGRLEEATEQIDTQQRLDPLNRALAESAVNLFYLAGDDERALARFTETREFFGSSTRPDEAIGMLHCERGRFDEGLALLEEARALSSDGPDQLASLAYGLALAGRSDEAREILAQLDQRARAGFVPPISLALAHIARGEKDEAFASLERAYAMRWVTLPILAARWPPFEPLRSDPRFEDLMRRLALPVD
ncbi:MAG: tetratricopeptide repeat protein [Deltaproteobacteria bacterium]|nr:tetratricopeptide repeat protein [Deltaproteobacteria bacterium]MBW2361745.1 tetratricopeptide repeat protein [Deltaproteobacteria bacterium]